jgi:hypothetical protein
VGVRIGGNSGIRGGGSDGRELLRHGTQLRRCHEGLVQLAAPGDFAGAELARPAMAAAGLHHGGATVRRRGLVRLALSRRRGPLRSPLFCRLAGCSRMCRRLLLLRSLRGLRQTERRCCERQAEYNRKCDAASSPRPLLYLCEIRDCQLPNSLLILYDEMRCALAGTFPDCGKVSHLDNGPCCSRSSMRGIRRQNHNLAGHLVVAASAQNTALHGITPCLPRQELHDRGTARLHRFANAQPGNGDPVFYIH